MRGQSRSRGSSLIYDGLSGEYLVGVPDRRAELDSSDGLAETFLERGVNVIADLAWAEGRALSVAVRENEPGTSFDEAVAGMRAFIDEFLRGGSFDGS